MSDLQIGLAIAGALAVVGVFAYNKVQENRYRKEAEQVFRAERTDVLLEPHAAAAAADERVEPTFGESGTAGSDQVTQTLPDESAPSDPPRTAEAELAETSAKAAAAAATADPVLALVDEAVDCLVSFEASEPVSATSLWFAQHEVLGALEPRLRWLGWDEANQVWRLIDGQTSASFARLLAALQLVDRNGPISDAGLDGLYGGMQQLADRFLAVIELPDRFRTRARARELDSFAAAVDVQIGINIVARRPEGFAGTKLRGLAEAAGLGLAGDGLFHAVDEHGESAVTLGNLEPALFVAENLKGLTTRGLTFSLDVPRSRDGVATFERMLRMARRLAESLDGALVDDNRAPLTDNELAFIRRKIAEFQTQMSASGIPAGGDTAKRLFA